MAKSRSSLVAVALSVFGAILVVLAFMTKNWVVSDGNLDRPKFERIGLWVVCFKEFEDSLHWYNPKFRNCWWVFEEEFHNDILFKGFYIATQFWFSACVLLTVVALFYTVIYMHLRRTHYERYVQILFRIGGLNLAAAACGTIALVVFGIHGNSRVWIPQWEHNDIGWSYGVAVTGTISLFVSGILSTFEARVLKIKHGKIANQEPKYDYDVQELKQLSHTSV